MGSRLSSTQEQPKTLMETTVCDVSFGTVSLQSVSKNLRFNLSKVQTEHFQKGSTFETVFEKASVFISVIKCMSGFHANNLQYSPTTLFLYHSVFVPNEISWVTCSSFS